MYSTTAANRVTSDFALTQSSGTRVTCLGTRVTRGTRVTMQDGTRVTCGTRVTRGTRVTV